MRLGLAMCAIQIEINSKRRKKKLRQKISVNRKLQQTLKHTLLITFSGTFYYSLEVIEAQTVKKTNMRVEQCEFNTRAYGNNWFAPQPSAFCSILILDYLIFAIHRGKKTSRKNPQNDCHMFPSLLTVYLRMSTICTIQIYKSITIANAYISINTINHGKVCTNSFRLVSAQIDTFNFLSTEFTNLI